MKRNSITEKDSHKPKVVKVILIREDGEISYLEGKDVDKYFDHINNALVFMQATRRYVLPKDFLDVNWKEIDKSKSNRLFE